MTISKIHWQTSRKSALAKGRSSLFSCQKRALLELPTKNHEAHGKQHKYVASSGFGRAELMPWAELAWFGFKPLEMPGWSLYMLKVPWLAERGGQEVPWLKEKVKRNC